MDCVSLTKIIENAFWSDYSFFSRYINGAKWSVKNSLTCFNGVGEERTIHSRNMACFWRMSKECWRCLRNWRHIPRQNHFLAYCATYEDVTEPGDGHRRECVDNRNKLSGLKDFRRIWTKCLTAGQNEDEELNNAHDVQCTMTPSGHCIVRGSINCNAHEDEASEINNLITAARFFSPEAKICTSSAPNPLPMMSRRWSLQRYIDKAPCSTGPVSLTLYVTLDGWWFLTGFLWEGKPKRTQLNCVFSFHLQDTDWIRPVSTDETRNRLHTQRARSLPSTPTPIRTLGKWILSLRRHHFQTVPHSIPMGDPRQSFLAEFQVHLYSAPKSLVVRRLGQTLYCLITAFLFNCPDFRTSAQTVQHWSLISFIIHSSSLIYILSTICIYFTIAGLSSLSGIASFYR